MALLTQAPRGTQDILPAEASKWQKIEDVMRREAHLQGFGEIRTPVFEHTELFQRSVGETTDVVQKEMYTFKDKGDRSITLRPEGTAGAVRAMLEHGLYNDGLPLKLYYFTSCYRYEKAQKGRLREFHQFGVEMFGSASPLADAQVIALAASVFQRLGIRDLTLEINSIGCPACRARYTAALREYFSAYRDELCETCLSRLERNPMRILDCKSPVCAKIAEGAPHVLDFLCEDCAAHFEGVKRSLTEIGIPFAVNPAIVRGLDYYTRTVFEFVSRATGAPLTVCGGGRYDGLVEEMGGPSMPALGFGLGLERALMILDAQKAELAQEEPCKVFIAALGEDASFAAFRMAHELRLSGIKASCDVNGRGLKAQMKYADKIGAAYSIVLGDNELETGEAVLKNMETGEKRTVSIGDGFLEQFAAIEAEDDLKRDFPQLIQE